jgi:hypothetical protein
MATEKLNEFSFFPHSLILSPLSLDSIVATAAVLAINKITALKTH